MRGAGTKSGKKSDGSVLAKTKGRQSREMTAYPNDLSGPSETCARSMRAQQGR